MPEPSNAPQLAAIPDLGGVLGALSSMLELMSKETGTLARHVKTLGDVANAAREASTSPGDEPQLDDSPSSARPHSTMPNEQDVLRELFPGIVRLEDQLVALRAAGATSASCAQIADLAEALFAALAEVVRHPHAQFPSDKRPTHFAYAARVEARPATEVAPGIQDVLE